MPDPLVRVATEDDVAQIAAIYAHHVLHGTATFEIDPPDIEEIARRRSEIEQAGLPFLVAASGDRVLGYAYAGPYRPRPAYRYTVEDSIYIDPAEIGRGLGKLLMPALIAACEKAGSHQLIAVIGDSDNLASIRLHERFGFRHSGVFRAVGFKFDRWLDTVLMQRKLG
ncbi:MAG TPA: GNAT family N-acetyltransferase [Bryobacteraceae bacterium]|jgi:L-amino acid N-acyltransferase YncA|nr:GNAT family N-acetyltransferase [Bryobacteraceae bacterium]